MYTLLSRCDEPKVLFSLISKEQFIQVWPKIKLYWRRRKSALDFMAWWDTIYENLTDRIPKSSLSEFSVKIGNMLRERRLQLGLSQSDLAKRARMKEMGKKNITMATFEKLCRILDIQDISLS